MELIKPGTNFDFVGYQRGAYIISGIAVAIALLSLFAFGGPNYGIDFTGGTMVQVRFREATSISDLRSALSSLPLGKVTIQDFSESFGTGMDAGGSEFLIRMPLNEEEMEDTSKTLTDALEDRFGVDSFQIQRIDMVGPRVGSTLRRQAILAVLFATLMMGLYIWFRFELRFGIGAYAALAHDVIVTLGALSLFNFEVDLTVVAALLTVVGFSVNDTVIISDRIRENMRKSRRIPLSKIINTSVNETLSRTVLTTGTALFVILALFFLGGNVSHGFAFTLLVGFTVGTYSSVFIASPIVLQLETLRPRRA
jgi:preprotein translocase subunit SecF